MANDCISVTFEDGTAWDYCWEDGHPDPAWNSDNVITGLRKSQSTTARSWRTCQYYLKGMPAICEWWKEGAASDKEGTTTSGSFFCSFIKENTSDNPQDPPPETPTGFNNAKCDFLGRRQWCSKYEGVTEDDLDEWICAGPNPYLTGRGEKSMDNEAAIFRPITRENIWGYNDKDDGTGTGQCDCYGMGRGANGCVIGGNDSIKEKNLSELPIVCNFYRPYQMGFGVIEPSKKLRGDVEDDKVTITDQGWARAKEWEDYTEYRLPLNYELYNWRAKFQKCQWWDEDSGRDFYTDTQGYINLDGENDIFDEATGRVEFCKCMDTNADPFNQRTLTSGSPGWETGSQFALDAVWAKGGGAVCNGARPECPCYSGKWKYLSSERMLPGMAVTANQILELRFWSQDWDNQDDYDEYYSQKPNFDDTNTPAIYTFTKWDRPQAGVDYEDSKMKGKKLTLCQPAPLHQKEFSVDYIKDEDLFYHHIEIGTPTEDNQRHFPTLIRNPNFPELKPLVVTYPYYNDNVFNAEICVNQGPAGCIKRNNDIYGDAVKTVGQTVRNKTVYVINTEEISISGLLKDYSGVYNVKPSKDSTQTAESIKNNIYNILREAISDGLKEHPDYIKNTVSDTVFGYFIVNSVKLIYNKVNSLLICVDLGDGTWEYRWRHVVSRWCGGIIKQTEYKHEYGDSESGYTNSQPTSISPSATAVANIEPLGGSVTADVYSTFSLDDLISGRRYFSYSIQEITEEDSPQTFWGAVGNTNKIWLELTNININYIYDWDIESAELRVITEDVEDDLGNVTSEPVRGDDPELTIELKKVLVDDNHIPPNACLLEPVDSTVRIRFLNSEWELYVTYKYEILTDDEVNEDIVWGANKTPNDLYSSPYDISYSPGSLSVNGISSGSIQLMAHFKDENDRVISAFATKLLTNIIRESCRNIDIFYRYETEGRQYKLMPEGGFCIDTKQDFPMPDPYKHVETPNCGDHEHSVYKWEGPMWFPFNTCRGYDMYDEFTVCNNCQAGYVGPMNDGVRYNSDGSIATAGGGVIKRNDYRYCGPYKYNAFGTTRGNWAAACDCGCRFWYSDAGSTTIIFAGYSRIKTTVDLKEYSELGYLPPPFGNEGRELAEKFISQDYVNHFINRHPFQRNEWMPLVLDHTVFFFTFNAYDDNPEDEYLGISGYFGFEPFRYVNQLNMGILDNIAEEIIYETDEADDPTGVAERFRWEDLFEVHHEGNCSYPFPRYPISATATKAVFYYLKEDWHAWAWQEAWKDIERNVDGQLPESSEEGDEKTIDMDKLDFLEFTRPLYLTDYYKEEHRRILSEGGYIIVYTGPEMDDDGNMVKYPSLNFYGNNDTFIRPFKILYPEDSYNNTKVSWANEGGNLNTQAGANEDNPYEVAMGSDWVHSDDTLFDGEAVKTKAAADIAGRKVVASKDDFTGDYTYKYFNRGLIVDMTRNRLYYLPKKEAGLFYSHSGDGINGNFEDIEGGISISTVSTKEYEDKATQLIPGEFVWGGSSATITSQSEGKWAFAKLRINGNWGYAEGLGENNRPKTYKLIRPAVSLSCDFEDGASGTPRSQSTTTSEFKEPDENQEIESYDVYLDFMLGPVEMLTKRAAKFRINFSGLAGSFISINEIELVKADYVDIRYEYINVWERKYIASEFTDQAGHGINLDGPGDNLHYQEDINNAGQYFSFRGSTYSDQEVAAADKTKVISCGIRYSSDVPVTSITYDNLHEIEKTYQKDLYEYAHTLDPSSDSITYSTIEPYKYRNFLVGLGIKFTAQALSIVSEKLLWEKNTKVKQFTQYSYWRPGGHFYKWSDTFRKEKCMLFGGAENVFSGFYAHVDHQGIGTPLEEDASKPIDPGNSYYSLRFYVQQAKYDRAMILAGGDPEFNDRMSSVTPYNAGTII